MRYRKKPVVVEAFQITRDTRTDNRYWPEWLHDAWNTPHDVPGAIYPSEFPESDGRDKLTIHTLEGKLLVEWGDYIIQGVNGEIYPCKPDIFDKTYDPE